MECLECVWRVSGGCLDGVWRKSGSCMEGFWRISRRCLVGVLIKGMFQKKIMENSIKGGGQ